MLLDVFNGDAFHMTELTAAINRMPFAPTRLGSMGLFVEQGIETLTLAIEAQEGVLTLVPTKARGAPGTVKTEPRRNVRNFSTVHLPQTVSVWADEVIGLRAFGKQTDTELAMSKLARKMAIAKRDLDLTHEWQRMGALKGIVYDSNGSSVIYNYFTEFGLSQQTHDMVLDSDTTKVAVKINEFKRKMEDKLGGLMPSGVTVLCSPEFFDAFISHPAVVETYKYQQGAVLRTDRRDGFEFGGCWWEEYRGLSATAFIAANKAYAVPTGVPDQFMSYYSPAPYMETVGTTGLPFYAKKQMLDFDKGLDVEVQSNPLHMNTRPESVIELSI